MVRHHADCEYPFRQDSNFWYLTGFDEPDSIALFLSHKPKGERFIFNVADIFISIGVIFMILLELIGSNKDNEKI